MTDRQRKKREQQVKAGAHRWPWVTFKHRKGLKGYSVKIVLDNGDFVRRKFLASDYKDWGDVLVRRYGYPTQLEQAQHCANAMAQEQKSGSVFIIPICSV